MSPTTVIEAPMATAHQHAANAEDFLNSGLLIPASEEHTKAAQAYLAAVDRAQDASTKRTLQMLYNEHCKAAKDLEKKIERLREDGKDPTMPQKLDRPPVPYTTNAHLSSAGPSHSAPSPPPQRPLAESQTVDESFMLLGGQRSDPGDAFNQFWNIMQGMLDNLSQPVAFATAPLGAPTESSTANGTSTPPRVARRDSSLSSDTDMEEPMVSRWTRKLGMTRTSSHNFGKNAQANSSAQTILASEDDNELFDDGDELSESFFLIPSDSSMIALKRENSALKAEVQTIKKRLEATERVLQLRKEQDMQLRDSIVQASKEAQRALGASFVGRGPMDFSSLNLNGPMQALPIPGIHTAREGQYMRRVKELEEDLRVARAENEKNKQMIAKFKERWEKLKESAKRKKELKKAEAAKAGVVQERIVEEPEAEEEMDGASSHPA
ncbi:hypothetical protein K435DRAFT_959533 [Dendrothele bispora CBS 962.96]|uniref:MIT domain-containing protein n=1 Tax=Dendrothele bispora (strain CBS 962.96) TaxID=1314807 RepID=A0A4S8MZT3_DENBC|nr:hypothetical protein K435DRAFT_959533 [Dendrothele bispora CBS 962.96]